MTVTIKDLAAETGLGVGTISAYLNGKEIKAENKEKIRLAVIKTGYIRNESARVLKAHSSMTVGVLIPELSSGFATTVISHTEDELRKKGYGIIVCDCRSDKRLEKQAVASLLAKNVDGLIIMPTTQDASLFDLPESRKVPVVVIDRYLQRDGVSEVVIDNRDVSAKAVTNMIERGAEKIAVIHGGTDIYTSRERYEGYKEAMKAHGLSAENMAEDGHYTIEGGYVAMKKLLDGVAGLDGVFAVNYDMALGALFALKERNVGLGKEIMFTGFDLGDLIKVIDQKVQVADQPLKDIGKCAAQLIIERIKGQKARDVVLKATIKNNYDNR